MDLDSLIERVTHHNAQGKFCSAGNAATVTKDGERYKVVRQHRKLKSKSKIKSKKAKEAAEASRTRVRTRGLVPLSEVFHGRR